SVACSTIPRCTPIITVLSATLCCNLASWCRKAFQWLPWQILNKLGCYLMCATITCPILVKALSMNYIYLPLITVRVLRWHTLHPWEITPRGALPHRLNVSICAHLKWSLDQQKP